MEVSASPGGSGTTSGYVPPAWESNSAQVELETGQGALTRASAGGTVEELEVSGHGPSARGALLAMDKVDCREMAGGERKTRRENECLTNAWWKGT
jgi:hypothetical protein